MTGFAARYPGGCARCGNRIQVNDLIAYDEDDRIYGVECCGDSADVYVPESSTRPSRQKVMPPGGNRTACSRCFIIHTPAQGDECD